MAASRETGKSGDYPLASPETVLKHPLENNWTLWYYRNDKYKPWEENQQEVMSFNTVEDFWSMYNHIERVSKLDMGCDYSFFKQGIKPMWEDEANQRGGKWLINIDKRNRSNGALDEMWLDVILCLIGETFEDSGVMVNGAVVNVRGKCDKICLWLRDIQPKETVMNIGHKLKQCLNMTNQSLIVFEVHSDAMQKASSQIKNLYAV